MKRHLITFALLCVLATLCSAPALAGSVTLDNTKGPYAVKLRVDSYAFGIPTTEYLCANAKESKYLGNILSIGTIYINPAGEAGCANVTRTFDITKMYKIPGTWLPHRGFTVKIDQWGGYKVTE